MVTVFAPLSEVTPAEFRRVTEVTYLGTVHGTMAALRRMRTRDRGVIVQVGSALAYRSIPLQSSYSGAKAAIRGFTDSVRCELLHERSKVKLTMVHLPALNTPQFVLARNRLRREPQPLPPIYQPEVAAEAIAWATAHPRREVLVGGPTMLAVVGAKLAASVGDLYLARTGTRHSRPTCRRIRIARTISSRSCPGIAVPTGPSTTARSRGAYSSPSSGAETGSSRRPPSERCSRRGAGRRAAGRVRPDRGTTRWSGTAGPWP
jgi:hypothetical protein